MAYNGDYRPSPMARAPRCRSSVLSIFAHGGTMAGMHTEPRAHRLVLLLTVQERRALEALANIRRTSLAAVVRERLFEGPGAVAVEAPEVKVPSPH